MPSSSVASSVVETAVPVGLLGVASRTSLVRSVTAAATASRSNAMVHGERCGHRPSRHQLGVDRVDLERTPWVDDLVAGVDVGEEQLLQQPDRPGADRDLLVGDVEPCRQPLAHRGGTMVGVTVGTGGGRGDGVDDGLDRRKRVLVGGQFDGVADAVFGLRLGSALAGAIGGHEIDGGPWPADRVRCGHGCSGGRGGPPKRSAAARGRVTDPRVPGCVDARETSSDGVPAGRGRASSDTAGWCAVVTTCTLPARRQRLTGRSSGQGDAGEQTRVILRIIGDALAKAGATFDQVVRSRIFVTLTSPTGRQSGSPTVRSSPTFARCATMVEVARLIDPAHLVEIEVEAYSPLADLRSCQAESDRAMTPKYVPQNEAGESAASRRHAGGSSPS